MVRAPELPSKYARPSLRDRPDVIALNCPPRLSPRGPFLSRLLEISVIVYPDENAGEDQAVYVPIEPSDPFTEAIRTGLETSAEIVFVDPDAGHRPHLKDAYPDSYAVRHIGLERYIEAYRVYPQSRSEELARHAAGIAWKLQGANPLARVLVVISLNLLDPVLDAMEEPQAQPMVRSRREGIELLNPHPESLAEILLEYPALQWRYEAFRGLMTDSNLIDRRHAQLAVFRAAAKEYEANTGERVAHWRRLLARARNLVASTSFGRNLRSHNRRPRHRTITMPGTSGGRRALSSTTRRAISPRHASPAKRSGSTRAASACAAACPIPSRNCAPTDQATKEKFPANG